MSFRSVNLPEATPLRGTNIGIHTLSSGPKKSSLYYTELLPTLSPSSCHLCVRTETRRQSGTLFSFSWDHARRAACFFITLLISANEHESTTSIDLGVTNKFQCLSKFRNTESANNEEQPYM